MVRRLYDWTLELARHRHAGRALAFISFIESSVFPIPPDVLMIPMVIAERAKAWLEEQRAAWQAQAEHWQTSRWGRLGLGLKLVNPAQGLPDKESEPDD